MKCLWTSPTGEQFTPEDAYRVLHQRYSQDKCAWCEGKGTVPVETRDARFLPSPAAHVTLCNHCGGTGRS